MLFSVFVLISVCQLTKNPRGMWISWVSPLKKVQLWFLKYFYHCLNNYPVDRMLWKALWSSHTGILNGKSDLGQRSPSTQQELTSFSAQLQPFSGPRCTLSPHALSPLFFFFWRSHRSQRGPPAWTLLSSLAPHFPPSLINLFLHSCFYPHYGISRGLFLLTYSLDLLMELRT